MNILSPKPLGERTFIMDKCSHILINRIPIGYIQIERILIGTIILIGYKKYLSIKKVR